MAFFSLGKKKRDEPLDIPLPSPDLQSQSPTVPIDQVVMMKQQGYTNNQIVQALQSQGYNTSQVYDAINQAGLSEGFGQAPQQPDMEMQDYGQSYDSYQQPTFQAMQPPPVEIQPSAPAVQPAAPTLDEERIQEVAEAIINEKWEEFAKDIKKVIEWKDRTEDRIAKLEQQMIDLRMSIDSLTKNMMSRVSAYDQNIVEVGTEIKAMEKVFQKVLPNLTESVNKLDRMARGAKDTPKDIN